MTRRLGLPTPEASWAWFLDIDGTLITIARSPGAVRVPPALRRDILSLQRRSGGAVALITGRPIADVDRLFPGIRLAAAGQHGLERRPATGPILRHHAPSNRLGAAKRRLAEAVARHPGLLLEDKGLSLALHYRRAPRLAGYAHRLAREQLARLGAAYAVHAGKRVVEIGPTGRNKGTAIQSFMHEPPFRGRLPVFLGDDVTDEHGFRKVHRLGGHTIKVGPGPTAARWRLPDVAAVHAWLQGAHTSRETTG
jgi:trehalose 6-phosphate phosphatase